MKLTYDPVHNVAYLCFLDKPTHVRTVVVSDDVNVDIASDGTVYGIELLNASEQLQADGLGALIVVNEASGESATVRLPV
mgnify:CR=1 FL=1